MKMTSTLLKLVCLNIEKNRHLDRVALFLKAETPDVLFFQEVLEQDVPFLESVLQMKCMFTPIAKFALQGTVHVGGQAILTNLPLIENYEEYYRGNKESLPFIELVPGASEAIARALSIVKVTKDEKQYRLANTHFTWAPNGGSSEKQSQDLESLFSLLSPFPDVILCGDFNSPRGTPIFDSIASKFKDNIPPDVTTTLDKNLHKAGDLQLVVDGVFTTPPYQVESIKLVDGVSDHLAIVAKVIRKEGA
jgi:endonuclease/exonuclease/phosphatase family metal-dependent hydrolase